jgi:hypothetical protein
MQGLQHILTQAIDCSNLTVHRDPPSSGIEFQEDPFVDIFRLSIACR